MITLGKSADGKNLIISTNGEIIEWVKEDNWTMKIHEMDLGKLFDYINNEFFANSRVAIAPDLVKELETLRELVQGLESLISKLKEEHQKDTDQLTQRLRAAHFFDLRTSLGVMDRLVNTRDSVALTPKSNQ